VTAKKKKSSQSNIPSSKPLVEVLEEDEYGMPIKYRDEIMALSKQVNRNMTKRWEVAIAEKEKVEGKQIAPEDS
jgi:hypothetical protein